MRREGRAVAVAVAVAEQAPASAPAMGLYAAASCDTKEILDELGLVRDEQGYERRS